MSYDKGKTIKEYMGGGYAQPMKYQTGGYIPGISRALYGANLNRRVGIAQDEQREQAKALEKQGKRRGLFSKLGSLGGTALGGLAAGALAGMTGGLSLLATPYIAKGLGSAAGSFLGEKVAGATASDEFKNVGSQSSTGLLDSGFEELGDIRKEYGDGALGRSLATGLKTGLMAGGADKLMSLGAPKDIAPPSMNIPGADAEMLGDVQVPGIEDLLSEQMTTPVSNAGSGLMLGDVQVPTLPSALSDIDFTADQLFQETYGTPTFGRNQGGKVYGYENGGVIKMLQGIANKASFGRRNQVEDIEQSDAPMIDMEAVLEASRTKQSSPRPYVERVMERNRMLTDKYGDDWYKASNVNTPSFQELQDMIPKYAGGGLINMLPFNRRIM